VVGPRFTCNHGLRLVAFGSQLKLEFKQRVFRNFVRFYNDAAVERLHGPVHVVQGIARVCTFQHLGHGSIPITRRSNHL